SYGGMFPLPSDFFSILLGVRAGRVFGCESSKRVQTEEPNSQTPQEIRTRSQNRPTDARFIKLERLLAVGGLGEQHPYAGLATQLAQHRQRRRLLALLRPNRRPPAQTVRRALPHLVAYGSTNKYR